MPKEMKEESMVQARKNIQSLQNSIKVFTDMNTLS